jgi:hypothetical protein
MQGKGETESQAWKHAMSEYTEKISFYDLPTKIDKTRFINTLYTKTLETIGRSWDFWYGLTLAYKEKFGDANAPALYETLEGYRLGKWQFVQRHSFNNKTLPEERIERLRAIGFLWGLRDEMFERGFLEMIKYKEQFGNANAPRSYKTPDGHNLGIWQDNIKRFYKKGKLSPDKIIRLEEIGFKWKFKKQLQSKNKLKA